MKNKQEGKMDTVECRELIVSTLKRRGDGVEDSPIRPITEVYEKNGIKIAKSDPAPDTFEKMDLLYFARWVKKMGHDPDKLDSRAIEKWLDSIIED